VRLWVDVDNPPQTRYLLPLARALGEKGLEVVVTARDYGDTFAILRDENSPFHPVGAHVGGNRLLKVIGVLQRSEQLVRLLGSHDRPDLLLSGSRSAVIAARRLRIPSFVILDYEYVDVLVYELAGSYIVHPDVIDERVFRRRGIRRRRLMPFAGLKEDFSFADFDIAAAVPHQFGDGDDASTRVLFRPPAEESHYYRSDSRRLAIELLRHLGEEGARIIFSPRYAWQIRYLDSLPTSAKEPVVLRQPVQFVSLLKGVDAVVSAGGTMLREAAFLGVPAYSVFRSRIGAVDRYLASIGRLSLLTSTDDFSRLQLQRRPSIAPLREGRRTVDDVVEMILRRASSSSAD
jgi:hypothetical protein